MAMYTRDASGTTYVLMKEDVGDFITNIDPEETPIFSALATVPMNGSPHVVNRDTLATQNADNAHAEGADAPAASDTTPTQVSTYAQIFAKTARVGGSLEARQVYGHASEIDYQTQKKLKEVKRDAEAAIISDNATVAPAGGSTAGKLAGLMNTISTNLDSSTTTFTSPVAFNTLLEQTYEGGGRPNQVFLGGLHKREISSYWTTNITRDDTKNLNVLKEKVDIYLSDFGRMFLNFHWMMPDSDVLILEMGKLRRAVPKGRDFQIVPLAKTGDAEAREILGEFTIEDRAENAHAAFSALT